MSDPEDQYDSQMNGGPHTVISLLEIHEEPRDDPPWRLSACYEM